jgi:hypothetical protein
MAREAIWQGVLAGVARFARDVENPKHAITPETIDFSAKQVERISNAIERREQERDALHSRGQRLFAEVTTVGILARQYLGEESLRDEEIYNFVVQAEIWWNSFFHTYL